MEYEQNLQEFQTKVKHMPIDHLSTNNLKSKQDKIMKQILNCNIRNNMNTKFNQNEFFFFLPNLEHLNLINPKETTHRFKKCQKTSLNYLHVKREHIFSLILIPSGLGTENETQLICEKSLVGYLPSFITHEFIHFLNGYKLIRQHTDNVFKTRLRTCD